jgi:hypothetical protein
VSEEAPRRHAEPPVALDGLVCKWTFTASHPTLLARAARARTLLTGLHRSPAAAALRPLTVRSRWNSYCMFLPDGQLTPAHRFTLARLRAMSGGLLAICATSTRDRVPRELLDTCDAVYWKAEHGYDFSAFGLALRTVAEASPGAELLLLNDSVLGPFVSLDDALRDASWDLTGLTAWSAFEHHIQSYAVRFRHVTPELVRGLRTVVPRRLAFDHFQDVVNWQETRLARVASRFITAGALWFEPRDGAGDPSLERAIPLLQAGFPFLKRSLYGGKLAHRFDQQQLRRLLEDRGHPV